MKTTLKVKIERTYVLGSYENIRPCYEIEEEIPVSMCEETKKEKIDSLRKIIMSRLVEDAKVFKNLPKK